MATDRASRVLQHLRHAVLQRDGAGLTDGQLLGCFVESRDEAAFAALVHRHGPMVWGVCRRLLDHQDAEDAFQAAFLVLSRKAASILPREMVANWLYGVARQSALMARRSAGRRKARERQVADMPEPGAVPRDLWEDLRPLLDEELGNLPDKYRAVLVLCDLEGKTRKEAARQLGCPEGTVAGRLARAREMLAKRLARRGFASSEGSLVAVLAQQAAGVPASIVTTTIKAATALAAGQTAAGAISAQVALLTEGVLKAMLMTKLKIATAILLVASIIAIPATGLAYRAFAGEGPDQKQKQEVRAEPPVKEQGGTTKELQRLEAEVKRLQADIEELKKRTQDQARKGKAGDSKLVVKVYPVKGLTTHNGQDDGLNAEPLMRVIRNSIESTSWDDQGGDASMEFLATADCLVIRQSAEVHKQVQELLEAVRKTQAEQAPKSGAEAQ